MKKLINLVYITLIATALIIPNLSLNIFAEENEENSTKGRVCEAMTNYEESTRSFYPYNITVAYAQNDTSTTQQMTVTKTRTRTFTGSVSAEYERNLIISTIGISAEVSYGQTDTVSISAVTNVPPHTAYQVELGSSILETRGYISKIYTDCTNSKTSSYLKFTTGEYVRWK